MRIEAHSVMARRRKRGKLLAEPAPFVEQLVRPVALHPVFELLEMLGVREIGERDLMRAPSPLDRLAVHELWAGPAFRRPEYHHGPTRPLDRIRRRPRRLLDLVNLRQDHVKRPGQTLMHYGGDVALHEMRLITVTADQVGQFRAAYAREHGWICDLEPVEMKDRKNRSITRGIQKLVGVPTGSQRTSFPFAIANDAGNDQIRIVESGAIGVNQEIAELPAFVNY